MRQYSRLEGWRLVLYFTTGVAFGSHSWYQTITWGLSMALSVFILSPLIERFYDKHISNDQPPSGT